MRNKNLLALLVVMVCALFGGCESKTDNETVGAKDAITVVGDETVVIGTLRHNEEKARWEIECFIEGRIDGADIFIIKNYEISLPTDSSPRVRAIGKSTQHQEASAMAGMDFHIFEVRQLTFM
jgi:hypothetical protein